MDNKKVDHCGRSSSGAGIDQNLQSQIADGSTPPEPEPSHAAPRDMVSAPCIDTKAGASVTVNGCRSSDKILENANTLEFSVFSDDGLNHFVDLNSTALDWYTNMYKEEVCIPASTHSETGNFSITSLVSKDDHGPILPSGNIIPEIQNKGAGSAACGTKSSIGLAGGENSRSEHCPPDTTAEYSRLPASALPGTLVEIPGSQERVQVVPSSGLTSDVQYNIQTETMAGASDNKVLPQENADALVWSERSNAPLADASEQPTGITDRISPEAVVRGGSNENSFKAYAVKQETIDVPAGVEVTHNSDTDTREALKENEPVEAVAMEEDIDCGDRLPDAQFDACPKDHDVAGNFDLTNPTPSSAPLAPAVDTVTKNDASESKNAKTTEKSGGITNNRNDQMHASLQKLLKIRDELLRQQRICEDGSAECDMGIQTIFAEGKIAPKVMSILNRCKGIRSDMMEVDNSPSSGEGCQSMNIKRRRLTEETLLRNKCKELDEICRENYWIPPRYNVHISVTDGMYQESVHVIGLDLNMSVDGDPKNNPRDARESAAANMLYQLHQKAKEKPAEQNSRTPDATLPN